MTIFLHIDWIHSEVFWDSSWILWLACTHILIMKSLLNILLIADLLLFYLFYDLYLSEQDDPLSPSCKGSLFWKWFRQIQDPKQDSSSTGKLSESSHGTPVCTTVCICCVVQTRILKLWGKFLGHLITSDSKYWKPAFGESAHSALYGPLKMPHQENMSKISFLLHTETVWGAAFGLRHISRSEV